jgi:hypothetical protein
VIQVQKIRAPSCEGDILCVVASNICRSSVRNLLHVTHVAPRFLMWLLGFRKNLCLHGVLYNLSGNVGEYVSLI